MHSVSIIIPFFNRHATVDRCLDSIGLSALPDVEVILVDDCSTIPLHAYADPAITVLRLEENGGPVAARAKGAALARHAYLMFLDSDDALLPDWYDRFCTAIAARPGCDIYAFPDEKYIGDKAYAIATLDQYWEWVQLPERASDYLITMTAEAYRKMPMPSARISELWYIVQLFESGLLASYTSKPIFRYYQDAGNQLSKQVFRALDVSPYTRASLRYTVRVFRRQQPIMRRLAKSYHVAWRRRLLKEALLSLSLLTLVRLAWGRDGAR